MKQLLLVQMLRQTPTSQYNRPFSNGCFFVIISRDTSTHSAHTQAQRNKLRQLSLYYYYYLSCQRLFFVAFYYNRWVAICSLSSLISTHFMHFVYRKINSLYFDKTVRPDRPRWHFCIPQSLRALAQFALVRIVHRWACLWTIFPSSLSLVISFLCISFLQSIRPRSAIWVND